MNYNEARFKANANHDDGTVPWHNDPSGKPFKSNLDKPLREIAAFGCDRHVQGGAVCPHWCGQDKCGVVLAEPPTAGMAAVHATQPPLEGVEPVSDADNQWFGDMMILQVLADSDNVNEQEREVLTRWMAASDRPTNRAPGVMVGGESQPEAWAATQYRPHQLRDNGADTPLMTLIRKVWGAASGVKGPDRG